MPVELKVPAVGESITEVQIAKWLKQEGDYVERDENICEIETDKATVEMPAPVSGVLGKLLKTGGQNANVGEVIGYMEEGAAAPKASPAPAAAPPEAAKPAAPSADAEGRASPSRKRHSHLDQQDRFSSTGGQRPGSGIEARRRHGACSCCRWRS